MDIGFVEHHHLLVACVIERPLVCLAVIARKKRINKDFEIEGKAFAFDSTTIDLCLSVFWWAKFRRTKAGRTRAMDDVRWMMEDG